MGGAASGLRRRALDLFLGALRVLERTGAEVRVLTDGRGRRSGVRVHWLRDEPDVLRGAIKCVSAGGEELRFFIADDMDHIQGFHRRGEIYEAEELAIIARHFAGGTFVDVGGNVGNHAIYAAKILRASRVVVFEPEPLAARMCEINIALNDCPQQVSLHRLGLSDRPRRARATEEPGNLGATRLSEDCDGPIELVRGDDQLASEQVGFIKVDTEGLELAVLTGLEGTIARCRPLLFVEVENENVGAFSSFCDEHGYRIAEEFRRYGAATNFLALPADPAAR